MQLKYAIFLLSILFFSCKDEPPVLNTSEFAKTEGNCSQACAEFKIRYPAVVSGSAALRDSVQRWVENVVRDYGVMSEETMTQRVALDETARRFFELWKNDESGMSYGFEVKDSVLALGDQFLSLRLDIYTFTGGAHPNYASELAVFDVKTGKLLPVSNYIKDPNAILPMLDIAYRAEKKEAFEAGFSYEGGQITFPVQCAITENGVLFHYNTYEIGPYVMGDADIFLTWTDLGAAAVAPFKK